MGKERTDGLNWKKKNKPDGLRGKKHVSKKAQP
jgi:hypothetical protein